MAENNSPHKKLVLVLLFLYFYICVITFGTAVSLIFAIGLRPQFMPTSFFGEWFYFLSISVVFLYSLYAVYSVLKKSEGCISNLRLSVLLSLFLISTSSLSSFSFSFQIWHASEVLYLLVFLIYLLFSKKVKNNYSTRLNRFSFCGLLYFGLLLFNCICFPLQLSGHVNYRLEAKDIIKKESQNIDGQLAHIAVLTDNRLHFRCSYRELFNQDLSDSTIQQEISYLDTVVNHNTICASIYMVKSDSTRYLVTAEYFLKDNYKTVALRFLTKNKPDDNIYDKIIRCLYKVSLPYKD